MKRRRQVWAAGVLGLSLIPTMGVGCLPDNALASVLGEQLTQTTGVLSSSIIGFVYGLPDAILNSIVLRVITSFAGI